MFRQNVWFEREKAATVVVFVLVFERKRIIIKIMEFALLKVEFSLPFVGFPISNDYYDRIYATPAKQPSIHIHSN